MATIANIQKEYLYGLQDLGSLLEQINAPPSTDVRDRAIIAAVNYYSRRLPRLQVALLASDPSGFYAVPSDWLDISRIVSIEFPINLPTPCYYSSRSGWVIQPRENDALFIVPNPNPTGQFRLIYTAAHGATVGLPSETLVGSIPAAHEALLGMIATEQACREFAQRFSNSVMSNVDSVDYRSKSKEFTDAANELRTKYDLEMTRAELAKLKMAEPDTYSKRWRA